MVQFAKRYELKDKAKDTLSGNYGTLILGGFLFSLIIFLVLFLFGFALFLSFLASLYTGGAYSMAALRIFQFGCVIAHILSGFLGFGTACLCLKLACGQPAYYTDVFYGFQRQNLLKTLLLTAIRLALGYVCRLPFDYFKAAISGAQDISSLWPALLACLAGCCIYIPIALALDVTYFLLLDFPDRKTAGIVSDSFRLMKGSRSRLFLLQLSFLPLRLLCLLTFGVGELWLEPYMHMTYAMFYLDLINPKRTQTPSC